MTRAALAALFATLVAAPALDRPADAFELKLWPLAHVEIDDDERRVRLLGPLVEWRDSGATQSFSLRPLVHVEHDDDGWRGAFLYPLAIARRTTDHLTVRLFGLLAYEADRGEARQVEDPGNTTDELALAPFAFIRRRGDGAVDYSLLPFAADAEGLFGFDRVRALAFPLTLEIVDEGTTRRWAPFPFLSIVSGPAASGFRIWPLYGETEITGVLRSRYVLWPFWIDHVRFPDHPDRTTTSIRWPFGSHLEGPGLESTTVGYLGVIPGFSHTVNRRAGTETFGLGGPAWVLHRRLDTGEVLSVRAAPFYQDRHEPGLRSQFVLWPLWRRKTAIGEPAYERTDVGFFLYRDERVGEGERGRVTRVLFPLAIEKLERGEGEIRLLALVDGIFPHDRWLETVWAPLWRLAAREVQDGQARFDVLWGAFAWGDGGLRPPWYASSP